MPTKDFMRDVGTWKIKTKEELETLDSRLDTKLNMVDIVTPRSTSGYRIKIKNW